MRFLVKLENFETIVDPDDIRRVREIVGRKTKALHESGKVIESGVLADTRGAFFLLDVESADELTRLFFPAQDFARMDVHPVYSWETLEKLFAEEAEGAAN